MMLSVVVWKWGRLFDATYVNRMRSMLERHLHLPHRLICITDERSDIDHRVECLPLPAEFGASTNKPPRPVNDSFRCRRRMWQYSQDRVREFGRRFLALDLDIVVTGDITPIVDRAEPLVMARIRYADVLSGSFVLADTGALHGAYERYRDDPAAFLAATGLKNASDQAMLNLYLRDRPVAEWTEADGFVTYFGAGYEHLARHGVALSRPALPKGARVVIFGSADKAVMDHARLPWISEHWR